MIKKSYLTKVISITLALMVLLAGFSVSMTAGAATMKYNIDYSKKASLTLYKYEMSDTSKATHGGTGEKNDEQYIPSDATRLAGVTFNIRKVAELYSYFKPDGVSLPTVAEAKQMSPIGNPISKTTDANGVATFTDLPLGIYYVEEGAGPSQITKKIAPFVLSLPLTNAAGTEWLYDVYSYPKNQTSYSDIKILKKDLSTGKALANAEFRLEESTDGSTYKTKIATVKSGSNGMIEIASLDTNKFYRLVETKAPSAEYILVRTITTPFYIDAEGQMFTGWTSISNKKPVGGTAVPNNTLELNNEKPTIHKSVLSGTKGDEGVDTTKKIGDTVNWKIKTSVPSLKEDLEVMKVYKIADTMTKGLSYKTASIMLDDTKTLVANTDYTVSQSGLTVTFDIKPTSLIGYKEVEVYFDTILNSEAAIATDIPNSSDLEYSNTATSTYKIESEKPTVHTGEYKFKKKDAAGNPIKGVQFAVYATQEAAQSGTGAIMTAESDDEGIVSFKGLAYGKFAKTAAQKESDGVDNGSTDYWINEIKTGNGYNLLKDPVKITVNKTSGDVTKTFPVVNTDTPKLTPTGGAAYGVMIACAGVGVLGFAIIWIIRKSKKNRTNAK